MCGIIGVYSEAEIPFTVVYRGLALMSERGTNQGAGFARYSVNSGVLAKSFTTSGTAGLVEEALGALTRERLGRIDLGRGVFVDVRVLDDYPGHSRVQGFYLLQAARYLDAYKSYGWPHEVATVYDAWRLSSRAWIGHTRFPTNSPGFQPWLAHPFTSREIAVVHNGDLSSYGVNARGLRSIVGVAQLTGNDSEVIAYILDYLLGEGLGVEDAINQMVSGRGWTRLDGPFAVIALYGTPKGPILAAFVDKHHFRPLYASIKNGSVIVASEAGAIKGLDPAAKPRMLRGGGYIIAYPDGEIVARGLSAYKHFPHPQPPRGEAINARGLPSAVVNRLIERMVEATGRVLVYNLHGQRYIANGLSGAVLELWGVVGNASLNLVRSVRAVVYGDVQEDIGDSMEDSIIVVHGNAGDALGQAMRSGAVYVAGDAGNRVGVQMKGGVIVVEGSVGDYLGEYMAGGVIVVLGGAGRYIGTGMVGGTIYLRGRVGPDQVGYSPPRSLVERYLASLHASGVIDAETYRQALAAETISELRSALGEAFSYVRKLYGSLHLGYPSSEYRYLRDSERTALARILEDYSRQTRRRIDVEALVATEKYTVITPAKA